MTCWPTTPRELILAQQELRYREAALWQPGDPPLKVGGCFVCFIPGISSTGAAGDPGWAGVVLLQGNQIVATSIVKDLAGAPYQPGLLALREGPLLEAAVRGLTMLPDVLLVNATGRDHPRRCGLALHLGSVLDIPTIGVTNRLLAAQGSWPDLSRGSTNPLQLEDEQVGVWLRTQSDSHPLAVHSAWCTDVATCVDLILAMSPKVRTPEPLRQARQLARTARAQDSSSMQ